jgi:HEPN domain-containing protein
MQPDSTLLADVRAWLTRANDDVRTAEALVVLSEPHLRSALFHCQQSVEKSLKAFLAWKDRPFPKTHDLRRLRDWCIELDSTLDTTLAEVARLTDYAWKFRYPGEPYEPTIEEAREAAGTARAVFDTIVKRVPSEGRP